MSAPESRRGRIASPANSFPRPRRDRQGGGASTRNTRGPAAQMPRLFLEGALEEGGDAQGERILALAADKLDADRQPAGAPPGWHGDAGNMQHRPGAVEDRVAGPLQPFPRLARRGGDEARG